MLKFAGDTVDEYIASQPEDVRPLLVEMRRIISEAAPEAEEVISYQMPAYKQNGPLVYFSACRTHIGFYPTASGVAVFSSELSGYPTSRGTIRFSLDQPLPEALIRRIVEFRVEENSKKKKR